MADPKIGIVKKKAKKKRKNKVQASDPEESKYTKTPWNESVLDEFKIPLTYGVVQPLEKHPFDISYLFARSSEALYAEKAEPEAKKDEYEDGFVRALSGNLYKVFSDALGYGENKTEKKKKTTKKIYDIVE